MGNLGDRLKESRLQMGLSQGEMARKMQENQQTWSRYENNTTFPPRDVLEKLVSLFNFNLHWLVTGNGDMFINNVYLVSQKKVVLNKEVFPVRIEGKDDIENTKMKESGEEWRGITSRYLLEDSDLEENKDKLKSIDLINIVNENINTSKAFPIPPALEVYKDNIIAIIEKSDSMEPTVKKSAIVLCDLSGFQGDGIYLIKMSEKYIVKRISLKLDSYLISSDNKMYDSFEVPVKSDKIRIAGQVRCVTNILY